MSDRVALVFGGSGLVGGALVRQLCESPSYERVVSCGRSTLAFTHPKLTQQVVDMDRLIDHPALFRVDDLFICLGTTMKKAGSKAAFEKVDLEYPLQIGHIAKAAGVNNVMIVTAVGANAHSAFFYNRVKGAVEVGLERLGFRSLHLFRPSLLLGERQEVRPGERATVAISRLIGLITIGPLRTYTPVEGRHVAAAMRAAALSETPGVYTHEWESIATLAGIR